MFQTKLFIKILKILPFIVVIAIMIPRLASPQFGLFDDAATLQRSRVILDGDFSISHDIQAGRFRLIYWIFNALIYFLSKSEPFWYFFSNLIILIIIIGELHIYLKSREFNSIQIFLSKIIFIFSIPIIENFYTFSKSEPLQLLLLLAAIISLENLWFIPTYKLYISPFFSILFIICSLLVKETSIIIFPIIGIWIVIDWLKNNKQKTEIKKFITIIIILLSSIIIFFLLRSLWNTPLFTEGSYTKRYEISILAIIERILRWMTLLAHYFHYALPILSGVIIIFLKYPNVKQIDRLELFFWILWSVLWIAILIPWEFAEAYFLLPFSLGIACFTGFSIPMIFEHAAKIHKNKSFTLITFLFLSGFLFLATLPTYRTHARTQLSYDKTNEILLSYVANETPNNRYVFHNIQQTNEYVDMLYLFLSNEYQREDISLNTFNILDNNLEYPQGSIVVVPIVNNQPKLQVRAGIIEETQNIWNDQLFSNFSSKLLYKNSIIDSFNITNINFPVLLCPVIGERGFCENPDPFIDTRIFEYGWEIYQIQ